MDPPAAVAVGDLLPAPPTNTNRRPPPRQTRQRGRTSRLLELTLLFTISFAILSLLKLEPLARNSVRDHKSNIDLPQLVDSAKKSYSHGHNENKTLVNMFEWKCWNECSCLPPAQENSTDTEVTMHQSYKSSDPQTWQWGWKYQRQTWIDLHPDWRFIFWNDEQNHLLAKCTGYEDVLEGRSGIQQADLSRLLYLKEYGGLYADMDYISLRNHEQLYNLGRNQVNLQQILLQGREDQVIGFEWGYARNQQHPLWAFCLNMARGQKGDAKRKGCPIWYTGPKFLNRCVKKYFKKQGQELEQMVSYGQNDLVILEPKLIAPVRGDDFTSECGQWRNHTQDEVWSEWPKSSCMRYLNDIAAFAVTLYSHSWGEGLKC